jgi:hypothetical protein
MSDCKSGFPHFLRMAVRRMRVQRLVTWAGYSFRVAVVLLVLALTGLLVFPQAGAVVVGMVGLAVVLWLAALASAWLWPVDEVKTVRTADARFGLPDHTLTSQELHSAEGVGWLRLQHEDTVSRLGNLDWKRAWPLRWPRFSKVAAVVVGVLLAALLALRLTDYVPAVPVRAESGLSEQAATVEELLKDWDKAAEELDDEELKNLLAELQPIREQLPKMDEREMLLALSKIENKLEALRDAASKDSLEAAAADMAAAFENVGGMNAMAAALRQKNFEKAAEQAEKEAEKLAQPGALTPKGADQAAAQQQMSKASQKLEKSGQSTAASAMQMARQSALKKDPAGMSQALEKLGQCMSREASRQAANKRLGLQLAQIGQCKGGMCDKEGMGQGLSLLPKLSTMKKPGKGAGSDTDLDRLKDPTRMDAARSEENLAGTAGEGESESENLSSDTPGGEVPRAGRSAQFAKYEKLSEQAIADESLPLAYREAIRKYFKAIRPVEN